MSRRSDIKLRAIRAFAAALLLLAAAAILPAQQAFNLQDTLPFDAAVRTATLPNGMKYFVRRNSRPARRVALRLAVDGLIANNLLEKDPIQKKVAAVSCGIHNGNAVLDLDYAEDSAAGCDGNFVLTDDGKLVEAQITAEGECFDEEGLLRLLRLARIGCAEIFAAQDRATGR